MTRPALAALLVVLGTSLWGCPRGEDGPNDTDVDSDSGDTSADSGDTSPPPAPVLAPDHEGWLDPACMTCHEADSHNATITLAFTSKSVR